MNVAIPFIAANVVVLTMGILIRRGMTWLIAGYKNHHVRDEEGLARWVGSGVIGIGATGILAGILMAALPERHEPFVVIGFVVVAIGGAVTLVSRLHKYAD
jgi:hypothetical protein